jgi:3-oxoacyl-[acyl-carrier protein] reductase
MDLRGKVAIVTGGGTSIGRAFSQAFIDAGANVCIADIDQDSARKTVMEISSERPEIFHVRTDVSRLEDVENMASACRERFGRIDILVNNAAIASALPPRTLDELNVSEWDEIMAVNLRGPFLCAKIVSKVMAEQKTGKIVNVSSTSAYKGHEGRIAYATSKAGLLGLTRSLARALGRDGICVNALMPGSVASSGTLAIRPIEHFQKAAAGRSIPRIEYPEDLIGTLLFLSSPASDFITGQTIVVDGGVEMR